jgi:SPP1 gp7 family putative phage head morphogenesis protein
VIRDPMLLGALACLSTGERVRLREESKKATTLERFWRARFDEEIRRLDNWVFRDLVENGRYAESEIDFTQVVVEHSFAAMALGMRSAKKELGAQFLSRLAKPPGPTRIPRSLAELRVLYDRWRRKRDLPPRQKAIAEDLKKAYLARVQSVWEKYGDDFRSGKTYDRDQVRKVLQSKGDMARARAAMIVQTETTLYYNRARRAVYDRSGDVTHYLFVALRDKATTKWCRSRQGLVFEKGTVLLDTNQPPCHWNCRSELLPLSPLNPGHLKMIDDPSRRASNRRLEPLPPGWTRR